MQMQMTALIDFDNLILNKLLDTKLSDVNTVSESIGYGVYAIARLHNSLLSSEVQALVNNGISHFLNGIEGLQEELNFEIIERDDINNIKLFNICILMMLLINIRKFDLFKSKAEALIAKIVNNLLYRDSCPSSEFDRLQFLFVLHLISLEKSSFYQQFHVADIIKKVQKNICNDELISEVNTKWDGHNAVVKVVVFLYSQMNQNCKDEFYEKGMQFWLAHCNKVCDFALLPQLDLTPESTELGVINGLSGLGLLNIAYDN